MFHVHFIRAVIKNIPNKHKEEMAEKAKYALGNEQAVQILFDELDKRRISKALDAVERFRYDLWNYKAFPKNRLRGIRTTKGME